MGCTSSKASKTEGDLERYHQEIFKIAQSGDAKRLKEILDELDRRKASTMKKEVLNMGQLLRFILIRYFFISKRLFRLSRSRWIDCFKYCCGKEEQISDRNLRQ